MRSLTAPRASVVGAGLVGSAAVLSLSRLDNVTVTGFERAPEPREAGAWISLSPSGLSILNRLVDPSELRKIVYRPPNRAEYVTRHWRTGEAIVRNYSSPCYAPDYVQARTHRFPLLKVLLSAIPEGIIQYGCKVVDIQVTENGPNLSLADGRSVEFDLVVAADGIYSVRNTEAMHMDLKLIGSRKYDSSTSRSTKLHTKEQLHIGKTSLSALSRTSLICQTTARLGEEMARSSSSPAWASVFSVS